MRDRTITGWIAGDLAMRLRAYFGVYHWTEFELFASDINAQVVYPRLHGGIDALRVRERIAISDQLPTIQQAEHGWHEAAHVVMHPANAFHLLGLSCGQQLIGKQERQAWEFVWTFPNWEDHPDITNDANHCYDWRSQ